MTTTTPAPFTGTLRRSAKLFAQTATDNGWTTTTTRTTGPVAVITNLLTIVADLPDDQVAILDANVDRHRAAVQVTAVFFEDTGGFSHASALYGPTMPATEFGNGGRRTRRIVTPTDANNELVASRSAVASCIAAAEREAANAARATAAAEQRDAYRAAAAHRDHPDYYAVRLLEEMAAAAVEPIEIRSRHDMRGMIDAYATVAAKELAAKALNLWGRPQGFDGITPLAPMSAADAVTRVILDVIDDYTIDATTAHATLKALGAIKRAARLDW